MLFSRTTFVSLLGLAAALPAEGNSSLETRAPKCVQGVYIVHARGNGGDKAPTSQGFGITKPLIKAMENAVPHSKAIAIDYPKTGPGPQRKQVAVMHQTSEVEKYIKACPNSPVVISGYSEGASITMDTVCGQNQGLRIGQKPLNPKYTKNVIAVIAYSDDSRTLGASYNKGSCLTVGSVPRTEPQLCKPYAPVIQDYCNAGDHNCCLGGTDHKAHFTYFDMYDDQVGQFVASQYKKFMNGKF